MFKLISLISSSFPVGYFGGSLTGVQSSNFSFLGYIHC